MGPRINSASKVLVWTCSNAQPRPQTEKDTCASQAHEIEVYFKSENSLFSTTK